MRHPALTPTTATHSVVFGTNNQVITSDKNALTYDAAGNVIQDAINNYVYDVEGRLCAVENLSTTAATQYVYDAAGSRVAKGTLSGSNWPAAGSPCAAPIATNGFTLTATYERGANEAQDIEIDYPLATASAHQNIYASGGLMATYTWPTGLTPTPALTYSFNDWLGTKRLEVNSSGQIVNYWGSDPFGDYLTPHVTGNHATENHFTGKERDTESQQCYSQ